MPLKLESDALRERHDHNSILQLGTRIRIIGDPGSGKSTFVKKLFRDCCLHAISAPRHARLPIFLELRTLQMPNDLDQLDGGVWLLRILKARVLSFDAFKIDECFENYVRTSVY